MSIAQESYMDLEPGDTVDIRNNSRTVRGVILSTEIKLVPFYSGTHLVRSNRLVHKVKTELGDSMDFDAENFNSVDVASEHTFILGLSLSSLSVKSL